MTQRQENHQDLGNVVFDYFSNQFAVLIEVYRENECDVWFYVLEYADGKKRERFLSEINLHPVRYALIVDDSTNGDY